MSPEQINIAITEHLGAVVRSDHWGAGCFAPKPETEFWKKHRETRAEEALTSHTIPRFCSDLNAMQEAERTLNHDQWRIFLGFLMNNRVIPKFASMEDFHEAWNSTSLQRAQAFVKTIGKWRVE